MLTKAMQLLIQQHSMGYYATISPDGFPNVSPKGMSLVKDLNTIMFGEVRSPHTLRNIKNNSNVEVNFLDVLHRKAVHIRGEAEILSASNSEFVTLHPKFEQWGELAIKIKHIVLVHITSAKLITSPAYDVGADEKTLKAHWQNYYNQL